jgi:autotransporter-associated beta strand protein
MKPKATLRHFLLLAGSSLLAISSAHAADVTWDITPGTVGAGDSAITGGAGTWNTTNGNWTTDGGANNVAWSGTTETAVFGGTAGAVDLLSNVSVGGLKFNTTGYSITSAANTITFGVDGAIFTDTNVTATIGQKVLNGSATVEKTGAGIFRVGTNVAGDNTTFNGALKISEGTVWLSPYFNATKSVGSFILNGGTLRGYAGWAISQSTTNVIVGGNTTVQASSIVTTSSGDRSITLGTLSIGAHTLEMAKTTGSSATTVAFGTTTLTGNAVFNVSAATGGSGQTLATLGAVGETGSRSLTKNGVGTLTIASANTYSGGTILNQGTLALGSTGTLGATTGSLQVNNSNSSAAGTAVVLNLATGANTTVGSLSGTIATPTSGTNTATINTQSTRTFTVNQTTNGTYAGVISGAGSFALGSLSNSALTLSGTNTYTGATLVSAGTLLVSGSLTSDVTVSDAATVGGGGTVDDLVMGGGSLFDMFEAVTNSNSLAATTISFAAAGFGIDNLVYNGAAVDWGTISTGTYTLITGILDETNLGNFGLVNAASIGGGRIAYFQEGSLQLVVAVPEPGAALLGSLGFLLLFRRRR